jgi:type IV pilus assembly protein PilE
MPTRRQAGFTVIELAIAMIVIALLAAVALPSFLDSIRKGRRSEAFTAMSALQQAQERWRSNRTSFTSALSDLNINSTTSPGGYYTLSIASATATGYEIQAQAAGSQVSDSACTKLGVKVEGGAVTYGGCSGCTTLTYAASNICWAR